MIMTAPRVVPSRGAPGSGAAVLLATLDPEQRAAATLPNGPAQIIAPAGSGKTTTLIARLGVLLERGVAPERICVLTFNRDAAAELRQRIARRLEPAVPGAVSIEVRTLHALARQVLLDAGDRVRLVADRTPVLRAARRRFATGRPADAAPLPDVAALDGAVSAWKVEGRAPPADWLPVLQAYATLLAMRGALDFDDLVVRAGHLLDERKGLRRNWQARFTHVCVDEFQDVDSAQLHLVRLLAEPERNLFVVGDDDQTIYAWRLADVRRILDFAVDYPDARRVQLATNYRCPAAVVAASSLLIATNAERFAKRISARRTATTPLSSHRIGVQPAAILAVPTAAPDWPDRIAAFVAARATGGRRACLLARTRAELLPPLLALMRAGIPHATTVQSPLDSEVVTTLTDALRLMPGDVAPFGLLAQLRAQRGWRRADEADEVSDADHAALEALLGWAAAFRSTAAFLASLDRARARLASLRDPRAPIELVTVHGAKGREWDLVVIIGFEEDCFPNRRALVGSLDPRRALEEERRLAYVAVTRATEQLVLAFDPAKPSRFLAEMGLAGPAAARTAASRPAISQPTTARTAATRPTGSNA
jgi:DNA helicase-2/ATP-dependent DNA helicase PcrA